MSPFMDLREKAGANCHWRLSSWSSSQNNKNNFVMPFYISWCSGLDNINSHWKKKCECVWEHSPLNADNLHIFNWAERSVQFTACWQMCALTQSPCFPQGDYFDLSTKFPPTLFEPASPQPSTLFPKVNHCPYCFHQKLILGAKEGTQLAMCLIFKHEDPHKKQTTTKNGHGSLWPWYWGEKDRQSLGLTGWPI